MLALLCLYFSSYVSAGKDTIDDIQCEIILINITFNSQLLPGKIEDIYVGTMCICHPFPYTSLFGSNIKYSMLSINKECNGLLKNKCEGVLPTNMIASLVIHNSFVYDVYMEDIANMKCQLHHIQMEEYFIQKS